MNQPPPIPPSHEPTSPAQAVPLRAKNWKRNRIIAFAVLFAPVIWFMAKIAWGLVAGPSEQNVVNIGEAENKAERASSGCGWGGCKKTESMCDARCAAKERECIEKSEKYRRLEGGPLSNKAALFSCRAQTHELVTIEDAIAEFGNPLGKCRIDGATFNHIWDNGPNHALIEIWVRGEKVTTVDEGRLEDKEVRRVQLLNFLEGDCEEDGEEVSAMYDRKHKLTPPKGKLGWQTENAWLIKKGMKISEVEGPFIEGGIGRCTKDNGNELRFYNNGPEHTHIIIEYRKGRVVEVADLGTSTDLELRRTQQRMANFRKCEEIY